MLLGNRWGPFLLAMSCLAACLMPAAEDSSTPLDPGERDRRLARTPLETAQQLAEVYGHELNRVEYIPAMALVGRVQLAELTGDDSHRRQVAEIVGPFLQDEKRAEVNSGSALSGHLIFSELAKRSEGERRTRYLELARQAADLAFDNDGRLLPSMPYHLEMSDSVFMGGPILAQVGALTGERRYFDACQSHIHFMQQLVLRDDGLYRHSPLCEAAWGRGNGFPALGMALCLADFPEDHPYRDELLSSFQNHLRILARHQGEDGSWHQVIDHPESYPELSCTAMITYAMALGIRQNWLDREEFAPVIQRAWEAIAIRIGDDGHLAGVCTGTGKQQTLQDYFDRPAIFGRDARGGAMALLVSVELARSPDLLAELEPSEPDYADQLPRIDPKSPKESQNAIRLRDGFQVELVATEPLIRSPMGIDFDEYGRAYVVQLPEYNQYASTTPQGKGSIKRLEDTSGDGVYDQATVYVDDLDYPTAVACWNGGVLVGVAPDFLYCKDTTGDGKADLRLRLFTGFGQDKAGEGMLNSFRWRMDNRFHIPTGLNGGEIVIADQADLAKAALDESSGGAEMRPINVRGQHLLLEPRGLTLEATSGGGQHGMSLDDWNLHVFVCGNSEPVHLIMYDGRYLARNPYLQAPAAAVNIAPDGKYTKLMRISEVEPWRALRTRLRSEGAIPGSDEGGQASGFFTGATGITVYRGDAWPEEYRGQIFVGEVANNLVYRARLEPRGVGWVADRADEEAEFLASSDIWFRPVQFANAPDGTLYVLDMYRELIEGAAFLAPQILKHMDPSAGFDKGRIHRIAPEGFEYSPPPRLGDMASAELVGLYEHPNRWHRDTASRLIYERQDRAAIEPLRKLAANSSNPLARAMARYSLQGLGALDPETVLAALDDSRPEARIHALRLAESFPEHEVIVRTVRRLADDPELRVRYQLAFTLGEFSGLEITESLRDLAVSDGADSWMQVAILSSVGTRRGEFLAALLESVELRQNEHLRGMIETLATQIGASDSPEELRILLEQLDRLSDTRADRSLAERLVRNMIGQQPSLQTLDAGSSGKAREILNQIVAEARATSADVRQAPRRRVPAIQTLAMAPFDSVSEILADLLESQQPQPVQVAALETLARFDENAVAEMILDVWPGQTPNIRATSMETLFTRPSWIHAFLDAVEMQQVARADLDAVRISLLEQHADAAIRGRAAELVSGSQLAGRQDVVDAYQQALELEGDIDRGRMHFRRVCSACHQLEGVGEEIGADIKAIRDRGTAAVLLNILDPNREVKPQYLTYVLALDSGRTVTGMIAAETANSLTLRKADGTSETVLRVNIEEIRSTGISFMPEGLERELDPAAMADLLAYLNSID